MDAFKEGWFSEINDIYTETVLSIKVNEVLYHEKSEYQDVLVVETKDHGRALILDGLMQSAEADEFAYQESISFLPLCSHPNPEKVLIIGGGGVAREVAKYPTVKSVTQVEIDATVLEAARKYLPHSSVESTMRNKKVNLIVGDGFEYMKNHVNEFDVIITDSSDPVGPSERLFQKSYFELMSRALRPGGIVCSQGGMAWATLDRVKTMLEHCRSSFPTASYCLVSTPSFPTGQIGLIIGSLNPKTEFREPLKVFSEKELDDMKMRYYSADIHRAAFVLPRFIAKVLS